MKSYKAKPLSVKTIRLIAKALREKCNMQHQKNIPICVLFEKILNKIFPKYQWEIKPDSEMEEEGMTFPFENTIWIKESVYNKACLGEGRARFTIAHEIGHLLLHKQSHIAFCRGDYPIKTYEDPEWQADCFAAELLMDYDIVKDWSACKIEKNCGVSKLASQKRYYKLKEEREGEKS